MKNSTNFITYFLLFALMVSAVSLSACGQRKPLKTPEGAVKDASAY